MSQRLNEMLGSLGMHTPTAGWRQRVANSDEKAETLCVAGGLASPTFVVVAGGKFSVGSNAFVETLPLSVLQLFR